MLGLPVGSGHFQKGVDLSDRGDEIGHEGLDFGVDFHGDGLVALDHFEEVFDVAANGQIAELHGIVAALHLRDFVVVVVHDSAESFACWHTLLPLWF